MISLPLQSSERGRLQNLIKLSVAAALYVKSIFFTVTVSHLYIIAEYVFYTCACNQIKLLFF